MRDPRPGEVPDLHEQHQRNEKVVHEPPHAATSMETRRLGRDGPELTRLGLGLAALGRPAYITVGHASDFPEGRDVSRMETHSHRMLDRAFAAGIRYFDVARSYGRGEQFVRTWIDARGMRVEDVVVGSKWGYRYTGDWQVDGRAQEVKDHSVSMLKLQLAESTAILGHYLRLYQIHSASLETRVLDDEQVVADLKRLRDRGLFLGITTTGPRQIDTIRRALDLRFEGGPLFSSIQATWNVLERSAEGGLREAHEAGFTVIVKEALANGRLTPRGAEGRKEPLRTVADRLGVSSDAVAVAFVRRQPWADVVLLGAATPAQLDSNLAALGTSLSEEDVESLDRLRVPAEQYWAERAALPWN
jgi:aryl-alcohol dehydrogenase-like predicted oxidoreductase